MDVYSMDENDNKKMQHDGFIKSIVFPEHKKCQLIITLNHDYRNHIHKLSLYLEFDINKKVIFGCYAGESILTKKPIASTVYFESRDVIQDNIEPKIIPLYQNGEINSKVIKLFSGNDNLKEFFIGNSFKYLSNFNAINTLKSHFIPVNNIIDYKISKVYQFEVFISIPLTFVNSKEQFLTNRKIALTIRDIFVEKFTIAKDKIYSACFMEDDDLDDDEIYNEYKNRNRDDGKHYRLVKDNLDKSKRTIFIFPKITGSGKKRISSSIIELGYSLGSGKDIAVFYDKQEEKTLPKNLMLLNQSRTFDFVSFDIEKITKEFNDKRIEQIRKCLKI